MTQRWQTPFVPIGVCKTTSMLLLQVDAHRQFCEVLMTALKASLLHRDRREPRQLMTMADEQPAEHQRPTETQIKMVNQYHRNLGHPSRREFLKVLKAAHAKPAVLEYVRREYRCADCEAHTKPQPSRKAAIPRTYELNRIIALDVFYIPLRGQSLPILNIICHGTNFQVAALMRQDGTPTAAMAWSTFQRSWRRYFGTPDVMITDGGPEFRGDFASILSLIEHSTCDCRRRCTLAEWLV